MAAPLTPDLAEQLSRVPHSHDRSLAYAPCQVTLRSGEVLPRVFVVEESSYLAHWGVDPQRETVDVKDVASVEDSPYRLPAPLADTVYEGSESGMGYYLFTVELRDGRSIPFLTGDAVDFPNWPPDVDPSDAVAVFPHMGREHFTGASDSRLRPADYLWCLYAS